LQPELHLLTKFLIIMLNQYETVFISTPVLSETQMKEAVNKFKKIITDNGGEIVHEENWGLRKLAYPIQKKSTGFYYLIEFKAEGQIVPKLEVEYRKEILSLQEEQDQVYRLQRSRVPEEVFK